MTYSDYTYYKEEYHGNMDEADYNRLSVQASAYIDHLTFGRINDIVLAGRYGDKVKLACCAVADAYLLNEHGGGVVSETVGKHTKNYAAGVSTTPTEGQRLYQAVSRYLVPTGLMYTGV